MSPLTLEHTTQFSVPPIRRNLSWADTEIWSLDPRPLPVECVPNASKPLNQRLSLRDPFDVMAFTKKRNTGGYETDTGRFDDALILQDLLRLCFKPDTGKEWYLKRTKPHKGDAEQLDADGLHRPQQTYGLVSELELRQELMMASKQDRFWTVLNANRYQFLCRGLAFNSSLPGYKNTWEGWRFDVLPQPDYTKIALYLRHIETIICGGDAVAFAYVMRWLAYILKFPGKKTLTVPNLCGPQGCGKNLFANAYCDLLGPYAERNIDDINDVTGHFNPVLENIVLAVLNEMKSAKSNKVVDWHKMKSLITETEVRVEHKFKDKTTIQNVCNFICISNHYSSVKQEMTDRRNIDLQCVMPEDPAAYFAALRAEIAAPEFSPTLHTYLMNYDVAANYDFVLKLPMTQLKQVIRELYKSPFEQFVTRHHQLFVEGW
jgi:hypothetical protein